MKRIDAKIRRPFYLAVALVGLVASGSFVNSQRIVIATRWVDHTNDVEKQLAGLSADLADHMTGVRVFVLTGNVALVPDLPRLETRIETSRDSVRALVADNPVESRGAAALHAAVDELLRFDAELLAQMHSSGIEEAKRRSAAGGGKALLDAARGRIAEMQAEEQRLMLARNETARRAVGLQSVLGLVFVAALAMLAFSLYRVVRRDVATREASEARILESNRFLDTIVETIPAMIFIKEARELRFVRMNRAGEQLLGVSREQLLGKNDFDFFPEEQARFFIEKDRLTLQGSEVVDIPEERIQTANGARWLHTRKVPIYGADGKPHFLLGVSEDITETKLAHDATRAAREVAEAATRELESFSYSVSHDLRAPLRAVAGFSAALQEDHAAALPEAARNHLGRIDAAARRMSQLIDDLLALTRINRAELRRVPVDVTALAGEVVESLRSDATPAGGSVEVHIAPDMRTEADPQLLRIAFDNLLGNAWKFSAKTGSARVEVGVESQDGTHVFFVRDNGAGFDMRYATKLFGAFQRLHSSSEFEGTGIGLATVQRVITRHGGRVWAEGKVGEGATFRFTLEPSHGKAPA